MMHGQQNVKKSKSSVAVACFLPGRAKDLSAPLYIHMISTQQHNKFNALSFNDRHMTSHLSANETQRSPRIQSLSIISQRTQKYNQRVFHMFCINTPTGVINDRHELE
jgi:hypothetical protein